MCCIDRWFQTIRGVIARGRLRHLRRAVDCFGFHLASLDMRQNSAVHERTVAELLDAATHPGMSYLALGRRGAHRTALERVAQCAAADLGIRQILRRGRWANSRYFMPLPKRIRNTARSSSRNASSRCARGVSDMLEVALLLKEAGLVDPSGRQRDQHRAAVRDHRGFAGVRRHHGPDAVAA